MASRVRYGCLFEAPQGEPSVHNTEDGRPLVWVQVLKAGEVPDRDITITPEHIGSAVESYFEHLTSNPGHYRRFDYLHNSARRVPSIEDRIASGWIHALEGRNANNELWALVDFTDRAKELIAAREFRYVSAELMFDEDRTHLTGATLTNDPAILSLNGLFESEEKMNDNEQTVTAQDEAPQSEVIELKKLKEILGLSPDWSVLDVLKHLKSLAQQGEELTEKPEAPQAAALEAKIPEGMITLETVELEALRAARAALNTMKAERAYNEARTSHRIVPSKREQFIKLFERDPELADLMLYEAGTFQDLTRSIGVTGASQPSYSSEGIPTKAEFEAASEELVGWLRSGKSEREFKVEHPGAHNVYVRGSTRGIKYNN